MLIWKGLQRWTGIYVLDMFLQTEVPPITTSTDGTGKELLAA
jgi:hypothetical protein